MEIKTAYSIGDTVYYVQAVDKRRLAELIRSGGKPCLIEVRHGEVDSIFITERFLGNGLCVEYGVTGSQGYYAESELYATEEEAQKSIDKGTKKLTK